MSDSNIPNMPNGPVEMDDDAAMRIKSEQFEAIAILEEALLASGYGIRAPIPEADRYSVPVWVWKARTLLQGFGITKP